MSNEVKNTQNQIILLLVSPPYLLLILNLLHPFLGFIDFSNNSIPSPDFENQHYLGLWIWLFLIPYAILFYKRDNQIVHLPTKLAICGAGAIALLHPITQDFGWPYFLMLLLITGVAMYGLYWKATGRKKTDFGPYPLAIDNKGQIGFPTDSLHMNVQIVGGTGTGKTHYVIKPLIEQTIEQNLGCFIYDVKGNMERDVAFYLKKSGLSGQKGLYHFNVADPRCSDTYNPLYGDNADAIANRIFTALYFDTRNSEPYYVELAKAFLHNLVGLLKKEIKTITFLDLLLAAEEADSFRSIQWLCAKHSDTPYARYFKNQWLGKSAKQRQEELSGLVNKLQRFCNNEWSHLLNVRRPKITMEHVVKNHMVFLFSPDAARYPDDAKPLAILAMMDLSEQVAGRYGAKPEKPFRVFLDEFYNLAYPRFIDFINKCREAQVNLFLAHQSLGDLRGVSEEFQEQVMNTARNKIILGVDDPETAEHFSRQFGTEEDKDYEVKSYKSDGTMAGYSKPKVEKFRFHPNLIKGLRTGQAIVKVVGRDGVHVFPTQLRPATPIPEDFRPYHSNQRAKHEMKNESSLAELMKPKGGEDPKPEKPTDNGMGDEDAA